MVHREILEQKDPEEKLYVDSDATLQNDIVS